MGNFIKRNQPGTLRALPSPTPCKAKPGPQDGLAKLAHLGCVQDPWVTAQGTESHWTAGHRNWNPLCRAKPGSVLSHIDHVHRQTADCWRLGSPGCMPVAELEKLFWAFILRLWGIRVLMSSVWSRRNCLHCEQLGRSGRVPPWIPDDRSDRTIDRFPSKIQSFGACMHTDRFV